MEGYDLWDSMAEVEKESQKVENELRKLKKDLLTRSEEFKLIAQRTFQKLTSHADTTPTITRSTPEPVQAISQELAPESPTPPIRGIFVVQYSRISTSATASVRAARSRKRPLQFEERVWRLGVNSD